MCRLSLTLQVITLYVPREINPGALPCVMYSSPHYLCIRIQNDITLLDFKKQVSIPCGIQLCMTYDTLNLPGHARPYKLYIQHCLFIVEFV